MWRFPEQDRIEELTSGKDLAGPWPLPFPAWYPRLPWPNGISLTPWPSHVPKVSVQTPGLRQQDVWQHPVLLEASWSTSWMIGAF